MRKFCLFTTTLVFSFLIGIFVIPTSQEIGKKIETKLSRLTGKEEKTEDPYKSYSKNPKGEKLVIENIKEWVVYKNENCGFQIKYPKEWGSPYEMPKHPHLDTGKDFVCRIALHEDGSKQQPSGSTFEDGIRINLRIGNSDRAIPSIFQDKDSNFSCNGFQGIQHITKLPKYAGWTGIQGKTTSLSAYFKKKNGKICEINADTVDPNNLHYEKVICPILSNFEFL